MTMTVLKELPLHVLELENADFERWKKRHPKKFRKIEHELQRVTNSVRVPRTQSGTQRVAVLMQQMTRAFEDAYPRDTKKGVMHFVTLQNDVKQTDSKIVLGLVPVFKMIYEDFDIQKAEKEVKERHFKGSFTPVRQYPHNHSKYMPHQGAKETARRVRQCS